MRSKTVHGVNQAKLRVYKSLTGRPAISMTSTAHTCLFHNFCILEVRAFRQFCEAGLQMCDESQAEAQGKKP